MVPTQSKQTPLDMLVISQLAAIRRAEAKLQEQRIAYPLMEASLFASEVWKLQTSADRLGRMIDAMKLNGSPLANTFASNKTAA